MIAIFKHRETFSDKYYGAAVIVKDTDTLEALKGISNADVFLYRVENTEPVTDWTRALIEGSKMHLAEGKSLGISYLAKVMGE